MLIHCFVIVDEWQIKGEIKKPLNPFHTEGKNPPTSGFFERVPLAYSQVKWLGSCHGY